MSADLRRAYEEILPLVEKPARYTGGEHGAVRGEPPPGTLRFALAFPEVYEIAQSHLGYQVLYDLLNRHPGVRAERIYAAWTDLERELRRRAIPLVSLETFTPLAEFDVVGISLQYELTYTNVLAMLDLGGLPMLAADRGDRHPIVIGGGPAAFNPEPIAPFLDAVLLGDGEEAVIDVVEVVRAARGRPRSEVLERLAAIEGIYVPSRFEAVYDERGRLREMRPVAGQRPVIRKRILRDLDTVPTPEIHVTPSLRIVHDRASVEVMRGCVKGCRFCQAGYVYRPLRERDPHAVVATAERLLADGGYDELSLLSLSTADYSCVNPVLSSVMERFASERVSVSLPSTRVEALSPAILEEIRRVRKTGFTLAPEAGTQRMRDVIQKEYTEAELLEAARTLYGMGWRQIKLYFMCGLPGEGAEDLVGIAELARAVGAEAPSGRGTVTASVSNFVPKPHTPFQWVAQTPLDETMARQGILREECRRRRVDFKWHDARLSFLEGIFSRGDRTLSGLLMRAFERGCRFDGWSEAFRWDDWRAAIEECGVRPEEWLRRRELDEVLPWDHLDSGVDKKWLQEELRRAVEGRLTPDCSIERCTYCGACDFESVRNVDYHRTGAKGAEHRGERVDSWARERVVAEDEWETRAWRKITARTSDKTERLRRRREGEGPDGRAIDAARPPQSPPAEGVLAERSLGVAPAIADPGSGHAEEWLEGDPSGLPARPGVDTPSVVARYRAEYRKRGPARFLGTLEIVNVFSRAARRARLPVAYSRGHHPLPRIAFGPALAVGIESDCELLDLELTEARDPTTVAASLGAALPEGLEIVAVAAVPLDSPSIEGGVSAIRYRVDLESLPADKRAESRVAERVSRFLAGEPLAVEKRSGRRPARTVDGREFVHRLRCVPAEALEIDVAFGAAGSIKPQAFVEALLSLAPDEARGLRVRKLAALAAAPAACP
jgi:radical SAM family uncharacterized protein/radical SAM-linked protein